MDFLSDDSNQYITEEPKKKQGGAKKCEHGRHKYYCKDCGGSAFCEHGKRKSRCKKCGGGEFCEHGKNKYICKDCGGKGICEHGIQKHNCKECGDIKYCEHGKPRGYRCKECKGAGICEHGNVTSDCKECGGSAICKHKKHMRFCKECNGSQICKHGRVRSTCKICGGGSICKHGKVRYTCEDCGGKAHCKHGKWKESCKKCGGSMCCKSSWCETIASTKKYDGYCLYCFMHLFPDKKVARNYKTKEKDVVDRVKEAFPDFTWVHDKKVEDGCSKRRPDLLLDLGTHIVIVEIDENKHSDYDCSCENKRLMELSQDVHHRPIVFIRFNPDKYVDGGGKTVQSCWRMNKNGILTITKTKAEEWKQRINILKDTIQYWTDNPVEKTVEIIELFY
jgi:hypothetical protein